MSGATRAETTIQKGGVRGIHRLWIRALGVAAVALPLLAASPLSAQVGGNGSRSLDAAAIERGVAAQEKHQAALLARPGVAGVGLTVHNGEPALLVLVAKNRLRPDLPAMVDGLPVVVEEGFEATLINGGQGCNPCHANKLSLPVGMGNSTSSATACDAGTLGFKVCDTQSHTLGYVTAWHVATRGANGCPGGAPNGTSQLHRGKFDAACAAESNIGTLVRSAPVQPYPTPMWADASFVSSTDSQTSGSIRDIGYPRNTTGSWVLNTCVSKSGRTTGQTFGRVNATHLTLDISDGCVQRRFSYVFRIAPDSTCGTCTNPTCNWFGIGGDSGSAVISGPREVAGLLFANQPGPGSTVLGLANPIEFVLSGLNVSLDLSSCQ